MYLMNARENPMVKSAKRVLDILEYFSSPESTASVTELSRLLGFPQSSTSALLDTLEELGYVVFDAEARAYRATIRVMLLGTALQDELFADGSLLSAMHHLNIESGQTVRIGMRQGTHVRYIISLRGRYRRALPANSRIVAPVCRTAVGKVLLSCEADSDVELIARRANAEATDSADRVHIPDLLEEIRQIRVVGWAESTDFPEPGHGGIAALMPPIPRQPRFALGLGAETEWVREHRFHMAGAVMDACAGLLHSGRGVDGKH